MRFRLSVLGPLRRLLLLLLLLLLVLLAAAGCGHRGPKAEERLMPATLQVPARDRQDVKVYRVRVLVDAKYRARPFWRGDLDELVEVSNGVFAPTFGARLAIEEVRDWERLSPAGARPCPA